MAPRRVWRAVDADLFRFTTTDLRDLHVALMTAFEDAAVLAPALNLDQVRAALAAAGWDEPLGDDVLAAGPRRPRRVGAARGHAGPRRPLRHARGVRAQEPPVVAHAAGARRRSAGCCTRSTRCATPSGCSRRCSTPSATGSADLADLLARPPSGRAPTPASTSAWPRSRATSPRSWRSVRQFNGHLQRLLRDDATDDDVFVDVKRRTVAYLEEYVDGVERPQRRVAIGDRPAGRRSASRRCSTGRWPAPTWRRSPAATRRRPGWPSGPAGGQALRAWFAPADGRPRRASPGCSTSPAPPSSSCCGCSSGAGTAAGARRRWPTTSSAWPSCSPAAPGEAEAHRLFGAAFGLWPARHAHLAPADGEARAPVTRRGRRRRRSTWRRRCARRARWPTPGRLRPVADPAAVRAAAPARAGRRARRPRRRLRSSLATDGAVRLSTFGRPAGRCVRRAPGPARHRPRRVPMAPTAPAGRCRSTGGSRSCSAIPATGAPPRCTPTPACSRARPPGVDLADRPRRFRSAPARGLEEAAGG